MPAQHNSSERPGACSQQILHENFEAAQKEMDLARKAVGAAKRA